MARVEILPWRTTAGMLDGPAQAAAEFERAGAALRGQ